MKMPWHNQTGLAKAAALLATIFGIAIGLCGANYVAVLAFVRIASVWAWAFSTLAITAYLEVAAMVLSALGLIVIALIAICRAISQHFFPSTDEDRK